MGFTLGVGWLLSWLPSITKYVVLFTFPTLNLPSVEKCKTIPFCMPYGISLVHQTLIWSLVTIGRFKFIDNNAILIKLHTFFFHFGDMIGVLNGEKFAIFFTPIFKSGACVLSDFSLPRAVEQWARC